MMCQYCGAPLEEGTSFCTQCGAPIPEAAPAPAPAPVPQPEKQPEITKRKKPLHPAVKVLLKIATVLLCLILSAALTATMLVADLQRLTSKNGLASVFEDLLYEPPQAGPIRTTASLGGLELDTRAPEGLDQGGLVDWFYDAMQEQYGSSLNVTREQMETFLAESTAKEYVSEKLASYTNDLVNGTRETTVTEDEILDLLDENLELAEEIFHIKVDRTLRNQVADFLKQNDIDTMIRTQVLDRLEHMEISGSAYTVADLMAVLRTLTSGGTLAVLIVLDLLLIALLLLTNRLRPGSTMVSAGVPMLVVGLILSLPVALIQFLPAVLGDSLGIAAIAVDLAAALAGAIAPIHYGTAAAGLLLIIAGAVINAVTAKRKAARPAVS